MTVRRRLTIAIATALIGAACAGGLELHNSLDIRSTNAANTGSTRVFGGGPLKASINITGLNRSYLRAGGDDLWFSVTVTNRTAQPLTEVAPIVSLGHCTCTARGIMPAGLLDARTGAIARPGTLSYLDARTGAWKSVQFAREGFATDYLSARQYPHTTIAANGSLTVKYRLRLASAQKLLPFKDGQGNLDVTLIGRDATTSLPAPETGTTEATQYIDIIH